MTLRKDKLKYPPRLKAKTSKERGNALLLTGVRFGQLVAEKCVGSTKEGRIWECRCDCGAICVRSARSFASGRQSSCGCGQIAAAAQTCLDRATHGKTTTPLYVIWRSMISRCEYRGNVGFKNYGGRGISVCKEWRVSFPTFEKWAIASGYRRGLSIDRINNDTNYHPDNCQWVDHKAQARNRRTSRTFNHNGKTKTVAEWAECAGIGYSTLLYRLNAGWAVADALNAIPDRGRRLA